MRYPAGMPLILIPVLAIVLILPIAATAGEPQIYVETFQSEDFKDPAATTAVWNTSAGTLGLADFEPFLTGSVDTPGSARKVVLHGEYAFVADFDRGIRIYDVSNPAIPVYVGFDDNMGYVVDIAIAGNWLFAACSSGGVWSVKIDDPANTILWSHYTTTSNAYSIAVAGDFAYVALYNDGLLVLDISDPANLAVAGTLGTFYQCYDLEVSGDLLYMTGRQGAQNGLLILDIEDPTAPVLLSETVTPGTAFALALGGRYAYVGDVGEGVQIIDIDDPAIPSIVGNVAAYSGVYGVTVDGDRLYVADGTAGLRIFDRGAPTSPVQLYVVDTPGTCNAVTLYGEYAFVADRSSGLQIISVRDPATPVIVGRCLGEIVSGNDVSYDYIVYQRDFAYVIEVIRHNSIPIEENLLIFDAVQPAQPTLVSTTGLPDGNDSVVDLAVDGETLCLLTYSDGGGIFLQVYNVSDPLAVVQRSLLSLPGLYVNKLVLAGNTAYILNEALTLWTVDVTDPDNPAILKEVGLSSYPQNMALDGNMLYIATIPSDVLVFDVSNPSFPVEVGNWSPGKTLENIVISGDRAYVTGEEFWVLDVSDPTAPVLAGRIPDLSSNGVVVDGLRVFAGGAVIDVRDPANPVVVDAIPWSLCSFCKETTGQYILAAGRNSTSDNSVGCLATDQIHGDIFAVGGNRGQSLTVNQRPLDIFLGRLTSSYADSVAWGVTADGGLSWQTIEADGIWRAFDNPGSDLRWRSLHTVLPTTPFTNPECTGLTLEWLFQTAEIKSIVDVPQDQGGQVRVTFSSSVLDRPEETENPVTAYDLHRRVNDQALAGEVTTAAREMPAKRTVSTVELDGRTYVVVNSGQAGTMPPGVWETVGTVHARQEDSYTLLAPTVGDSTWAGIRYSVFLVTTHTPTPTQWYVSQPDSGWSVDNICPGVPEGFAVAYTAADNSLGWEASGDSDFQLFRIYRGSDPDFVPGAESLIHETATTGWTDSTGDGWDYYYKITAVDHAGNESQAASPDNVTGVGVFTVPARFALHPNTPNPFNPATVITYDLPEQAAVQLRVFDVAGRLVRVLVADQQTGPGRNRVTWDGRDGAGRCVAAGVYLCRMEAGAFRETMLMTLVK